LGPKFPHSAGVPAALKFRDAAGRVRYPHVLRHDGATEFAQLCLQEETHMDLSKIPSGRNPPKEVNALIEIPAGGLPVKYEMDKVSGALFVDRFLHTAMFYPGNYGFIPHTLSEDGDPIDVLVISSVPVIPGAVVRCRPVGVLVMQDQAGPDEKIIAVPTDALHPFHANVRTHRDLPDILLKQIEHFFQHYKDLEPRKWTKLGDWGGPDVAERLIEQAIHRASPAK
jgi:inorganic pyrophosphatase